MKRTIQWSLLSLLLTAPGLVAAAGSFERDRSYEQALRYEASADKTITPAKVLRWFNSFLGHSVVSKPSATEFQPIVNVQNSRVRVVAALAYKF
jgi:hypothetical protein